MNAMGDAGDFGSRQTRAIAWQAKVSTREFAPETIGDEASLATVEGKRLVRFAHYQNVTRKHNACLCRHGVEHWTRVYTLPER